MAATPRPAPGPGPGPAGAAALPGQDLDAVRAFRRLRTPASPTVYVTQIAPLPGSRAEPEAQVAGTLPGTLRVTGSAAAAAAAHTGTVTVTCAQGRHGVLSG